MSEQNDPRIARLLCVVIDAFPELAALPEGRVMILQERVEAAIRAALAVKHQGRRE